MPDNITGNVDIEKDALAQLMETGMSLEQIETKLMTGMSFAEILKEKTASAFDRFGFYSVPDLSEEERRPPEFIIEDLLPVGLTFLSGAPKIRKSFLAAQMAIAVSSGLTFFGHPVMQSDVVYLDLEGSKSRISSRTARMTTPIPRNVYFTNQIEERLADGLVDNLRELHQQRPAIRLVVIDTYSRARGCFKSGGANAYDADVMLLEPLQRMAIDENIAVLCVHHDRKGASLVADSFERLSGTMGISGSCDCVMQLQTIGKRFDGHASLEYTPRDGRGGEMCLVFSETTLEWMSEAKPDVRGNPVCSWIIEHGPERGREGQFFSYEDLFTAVYRIKVDNPGERILEQLRPRRDELLQECSIGIQLGVKSNGKRGIRVFNLQ